MTEHEHQWSVPGGLHDQWPDGRITVNERCDDCGEWRKDRELVKEEGRDWYMLLAIRNNSFGASVSCCTPEEAEYFRKMVAARWKPIDSEDIQRFELDKL